MDQVGEVVDVLILRRRNGAAAKRFFKQLLKVYRNDALNSVIDKLRSYGVANRELITETIHGTSQYANNRAELTHQPTRVWERGMRGLKSVQQSQRFLSVHASLYNLFNLRRHQIFAEPSRSLRMSAFASWKDAVAK